METKLNIAEILKDKPKGTKLYSPLFGDVYLLDVDNNIIRIKCHEDIVIFFGDGRYYNYPESEPLLFPSKKMQDWSKFAWKKGDILIMDGCRVIFDKWVGDNYTRFNAVHLITSSGGYFDKPLQNRYSPISNFITKYWRKTTDAEAKIYMDSLERECDGKLNLETLEIEKTQPEFKDGDIVTQDVLKGVNVYIIKNCIDKIDNKYNYYARYNTQDKEINYDNWSHLSSFAKFATDSEKQQLFDALAKEGKAWDAEKKQIIDLKPKVELKPFGKVLVRDSKSDYWRATLFSHIDKNGCYYCVWASWNYCIPYEGNEHLLGTTKNVED